MEEELLVMIEDLIEEAEEELERGLDEEERDSLIDEFLAGLDEDDEEENPEAEEPVADAEPTANAEVTEEMLRRRIRERLAAGGDHGH